MNIQLTSGKKVYFASDFHLGAPDHLTSKKREDKIIRWLDHIEDTAEAIFLVGDIFDFWFEYDKVIPKGYIKFISKISQLKDKGIPVIFFTGNHDLWMNDYFTQELDIPVFHHPITLEIGEKKFLIGHGDGLGPGDNNYKLLKKIFTNKFCQGLFRWLHPDIGIWIAQKWSGSSRISNQAKNEDTFKGSDEWLWQYCKDVEQKMHFDYYIFGHRHLPLALEVGKNSMYYNLGEWVSQYTFGVFDGEKFELSVFEE
ncbi:UDP-2,3-diacylglucosamine diphosphatase [Echinicola strongylocentroti]|uniref:UDP-2,3-diacylglucosamine diphosphatase n=1 Tax=Echinicola strongylocentroti TaxID=1795355 RepID=A0A2Z4IMS5_9BACT|nr:UDP-2,3-diacylglucosamine diphosphatase [Echinicola strongylocentroti]AWW31896.1 UDP-2,3-diacylglucosamine diphosphatase [Echinicola strongylocentroti]